MKPPARPKEKRRASREQRRAEWHAATAAFILTGGHKDWLIPFHESWRTSLAQQTASIENGDPFYTKPRYQYANISPTGRVQQWRDEYPAIANAWQTTYHK